MHYYKRNIGDYHKKAGRLSMLQHGAYTLLIDACYDREEFPTLEQALEWTWASSEEEVSAVKFVLQRFFTETDGLYVQDRISEELDKYHENAENNRRIALEREAKRRGKSTKRAGNNTKRAKSNTNGSRSDHEAPRSDNDSSQNEHEAPPNQEPRTTNQEPLTKNQEPGTKSNTRSTLDFSAWPKTPSEQAWADYKKLRQAKRAPITQTVVNKMANTLNELEQHGVSVDQAIEIACERGWQGFKTEWVLNHIQTNTTQKTGKGSSWEDRNRAIIEKRNRELGIVRSEEKVIQGEVINDD